MSPTEAAARAANEDAFFSATLAEADPEIAEVIAQGARSPARRDRADRLGEHRQPRGARGAGLGADQQIRRGLSGPALLRRLPVRRHRRERSRSSAPRSCSAASFANVQPNSGSQMNQAVFLALMKPGDTFMGLDLAAGGHLTHGSPVNMSGKWFKAVHYDVRREDQLHRHGRGRAHRARERSRRSSSPAAPPIRASGTSSASARSPTRSARILMVDMAHFAGLVAGGVHPSPFPHAHVVDHDHAQDAARPARRHDPDQ